MGGNRAERGRSSWVVTGLREVGPVGWPEGRCTYSYICHVGQWLSLVRIRQPGPCACLLFNADCGEPLLRFFFKKRLHICISL